MKHTTQTPDTRADDLRNGSWRENKRAVEADSGPETHEQYQDKTANTGGQVWTQVAIAVSFDFEGQVVRTVMRNGMVWFVATDVCAVLEIGNTTDAVGRLDDEGKGLDTIEILGGAQKLNVINESGVYALIFTSRKPEAKAFRRWVTGVVLPALRQTGEFNMSGRVDQPDPAEQSASGNDHVRNDTEITVTLPRVGRYIVVVTPNGDRRIEPTLFSEAVPTMAKLYCRAMAYSFMTAFMYWERLQQLRACNIETAGGFSLDKLNESMPASADVARQILYTHDKLLLNLHH